ncbi:hypothetical protein ACF1BP_37175 [Streptomyces sp. NPDC014735]|uniref:hypothetical protein n=1 Tax=unclassified Streptomyces TaxID=2593676 RepID=UPI0036F6DB46
MSADHLSFLDYIVRRRAPAEFADQRCFDSAETLRDIGQQYVVRAHQALSEVGDCARADALPQ